MWWIFPALVVVGGLLTLWAMVTNPAGAIGGPDPLPIGVVPITTGPYRWLTHPMYIGEWLTIVGCAGLAAGIWNAIALGLVTDLLLRDWILREQKGL
jgi:protein-S-isoprenylcysteine O-methyltransferase Ste14